MNFDLYTTEEIHAMINIGLITNSDVIHFYNNTQWDDLIF